MSEIGSQIEADTYREYRLENPQSSHFNHLLSRCHHILKLFWGGRYTIQQTQLTITLYLENMFFGPIFLETTFETTNVKWLFAI